MGCRCVLGLPLVFRLRRDSCVMCVVVSHWVAQSGLGHSEQGLRTPSCLCNTPPQFGSFPHQYPPLQYLLPEQCPAQTPGVPLHTARWWWCRALHYCSSLGLASYPVPTTLPEEGSFRGASSLRASIPEIPPCIEGGSLGLPSTVGCPGSPPPTVLSSPVAPPLCRDKVGAVGRKGEYSCSTGGRASGCPSSYNRF